MPISFGNDFFGQVLGNTQDMLGDFMSQLPSYTDFFSVAPPTSTQLFGDQQNPFEIVPVPGDADPYGGVPYGGGDVGGEGGTNLGNQQQDAINRARYRTENPFGQPVNNPAAYGAGSSTGGGAPLAVPAMVPLAAPPVAPTEAPSSGRGGRGAAGPAGRGEASAGAGGFSPARTSW